ncbi:MAG: isoprenylcysteine carboxylmethyltransferase family protein [Acidobacteriota bacterium]
MRLLDRFVQDGDRLFRWRSYFPLLMAPVFLAGLLTSSSAAPWSPWQERAREVVSVLVAIAGLGLRVWAVGSAPSGTSERSTVNPRASELRTSGPYSVVRHPLYLANGLMGLGLALFPGIWYLPIILILATLLYYERIAAREEAFLIETFGPAFDAWAARVPAIVPSLAGYVRATTAYSWKKVLRHEFHGLMVIASGAFLLSAAQQSWRARQWRVDEIWLWFFAGTAVLFVASIAIKKGTRLLEG